MNNLQVDLKLTTEHKKKVEIQNQLNQAQMATQKAEAALQQEQKHFEVAEKKILTQQAAEEELKRQLEKKTQASTTTK